MSYDDSDTESIQTSVLSIRTVSSMETLTTMDTTRTELPPPYSAQDPNVFLGPSVSDPRSASTQSLVSPETGSDGIDTRRRLMLVYIHGFMGNETSFQSFPAHVHNLLSIYLAPSHVVHTKIYPRYRSRSSIGIAANNFSNWLSPHVNPSTDVILIGHSMGGILASEVVLLPSETLENTSPFRHSILGTINYDVPFLGMHPGVIKSGISSLFRPDPSPPASSYAESSSSARPSPTTSRQNSGLTNPQPQDPNFNPSYDNDPRLANRSGWKNASHFVSKHAKNLRSATQRLITSHIEFSSCLSDFDGLRFRYSRIRILEEDSKDERRKAFLNQRTPPRVRFVNYYTASTGKIATSAISPQVVPDDATLHNGANIPSSERQLSEPPASLHTQSDPIEDDQLSDNESSLSDLSDLDPLDASPSTLSERPSITTTTESTNPKSFVRQNSTTESVSSPISTQAYLPSCPFTLDQRSQKLQQNTKATFKSAIRQHRDMAKHNFHALKTQQKAEYGRLLREATESPMSHKAQLKAFVEAQKADRTRFYESTKAEWKGMYDQLKKDVVEAAKNDYKASRESEKPLEKSDRRQSKASRKLTKLDRKSERDQRIMDRKVDKIERRLAKKASKSCDFSTSSTAESLSSLNLTEGQSSLSATSEQGSSTLFSASNSTGTPSSYEPSITSLPPYAENAQIPTSIPRGPNEKATPLQDNSEAPTQLRLLYNAPQGPQKGAKFCMRPRKDASGNHDPTWIRVHMKGVDEVGAHCGLFFPLSPGEEVKTDGWSDRYAWMVGDVADRIEKWVGEAMSERAVNEFHAENAA